MGNLADPPGRFGGRASSGGARSAAGQGLRPGDRRTDRLARAQSTGRRPGSPQPRPTTRLKLLAFGLALILAGSAIYPLVALSTGQLQARSGPFVLVDQARRRVTARDLLGKPTLIAFGFTSCPDICPTTLAHMSGWLRDLGPAGDRFNMVYVTVDPERDTPEHLRAFLAAFDPRIRGLTGSPAAIAQIARDYRVFYRKVPLPGGYTLDHSTSLYLLDTRGRLVRSIGFEQPDSVVLPLLRSVGDLSGAEAPSSERRE